MSFNVNFVDFNYDFLLIEPMKNVTAANVSCF